MIHWALAVEVKISMQFYQKIDQPLMQCILLHILEKDSLAGVNSLSKQILRYSTNLFKHKLEKNIL